MFTGLKSGYSWSCHVPKAPVHDRGVTSLRVVPGTTSAGVPLRRRSYGLMRQSSTLPLPTVSLGQRVCAGCCQPRLEGGPSRRYLCVSFPACVDLYPGSSWSASTRYFLHDFGLPRVWTGSALHNVPYSDFSTARISRLQSFADVQAHRFARHPGRSYRHITLWQPWLLRPSLSRVVTSPCPGYAHRPHRTIDGMGTFTS